MTVLSARIIKQPRKQRVCDDCGYMLPTDSPQLKLYGFVDCGDKPYNMFLHIHCVGPYPDAKIDKAIEGYGIV